MKTVWKFGPGLPGNPNTATLDFHVSPLFKLHQVFMCSLASRNYILMYTIIERVARNSHRVINLWP